MRKADWAGERQQEAGRQGPGFRHDVGMTLVRSSDLQGGSISSTCLFGGLTILHFHELQREREEPYAR